jgi:hypothetical protein
MIKLLVPATTALLLLATSTPGMASRTNAGNETASAPGASAPTTAQPQEKRYCIVDTITGSRVPVKVCKTRKEWQAEGVDITAGQ